MGNLNGELDPDIKGKVTMSDVNVTASAEPTATPTVSAPAPATQGTPAPAAVATPTAAPQAPATGAPEGYVPSYRLRETREQIERQYQQQWSQREAELNARYTEMERKLQALAGVTPPANPEVETIKQQFGGIYPGLSKMEEKAEKLMELLDRAGDLESQTNHYWMEYGRQRMDQLFKHAGDALGIPLTDEGKRVLHAAFTGFVQSSPELGQRYATDPTLVDEFWNAFSSSLIGPARREAATAVVARAGSPALPQDTPGGAPRATPAPQHGNLDERAAAGWAQYQHTAKR